MKLKPCKPPRERHDWEHYSNKTVTRRFADGSVELRRRGIYYCTACTAAKYGEAREQVHVVVRHEQANAEIEARAAELHEGCQMPMEQARELAASEAGPDWYARGQDWGLADALTNGQSGDWVLDDIARAFAAGARLAALGA